MIERTPRAQIVLGIWVLLSIYLVIGSWPIISSGSGWDPDDQLRLVQLRDFLNGQSWFDNRQYRMNPPDGAPMHWSRLIELPLAAITLLLTPMFGQTVAEIVASTAVPLLLFGTIIMLLARTAWHVGGERAAIAAAIITAMSVPLSVQLRPMRIDHHGWQIAMAVLALASLFYGHARMAGLVLGAALAIWLHISLEGAPMSAAFFLFLGWQWLTKPDESARLFWTIGAFALSSLVLFFGTQTQGLGASTYCDTVSPPHVLAILAAAAIMIPGLYIAPQSELARVLVMATAGGAAAAVLVLRAPECLNGPFSTLDPLVRDYWYVYVNEGMPIWHHDLPTIAFVMAAPIAGLVSCLVLTRKVDKTYRSKLWVVGFFSLYALVLSLFVSRTSSVAAAYAVVPVAALIVHIFGVYRQSGVQKHRIFYVAVMVFLMAPGSYAYVVLNVLPQLTSADDARSDAKLMSCESAQSVATLSDLPRGQFLVPLNMAPMVLVQTAHSVLASGHHRNQKAMHDHIEILRSRPDVAKQLIAARGINYVALCPDDGGLDYYARKHPKGLWGQIAKGHVPDWLEPLPAKGKGIRVWRVR
ncbi:hypothetical protein [Sphingorhabdus sp.]|jgi:hypothetical protein|uniref:hypothetical protein n=1 Tax=Sphingorhabdus sp. TaxID=1902408 RepID=UPI0037C88C7C